MAKQIITFKDNYHNKLKDKLTTGIPRGIVGIYDKLPNGELKIIQKSNLIVYQGREWLLQRAFGTELQGSNPIFYDRYLKWFGLGCGGGEPGNPLQPGTTNAWDTDLIQPLRINPDATEVDTRYASKEINSSMTTGYYKEFSSVTRKEDPANGYTFENKQFYPELIAEIRIELSSEDGNGESGLGYADINEAGLYIDNPLTYTPSSSSASMDTLGIYSIIKLSEFTNQVKYIFEAGTDITSVFPGDRLSITNSGNDVSSVLILDVGYEMDGCLAYVTVENETGVTEGPYVGHDTYARIALKSDPADISMFSKVTFSTIRKTIDREIVFLWKIYF
jgi:hypothetical protein